MFLIGDECLVLAHVY